MTALSSLMKNRPEVQPYNDNLMLSIPNYSNKLQPMRHNYLHCKIYSLRVKMRKNSTESLHEEACAKHAKLTDQFGIEDQNFRYVIDYRVNSGNGRYELPIVNQILESRPHLRPTGRVRSFS
jgi:hypothetical protein